MVRILKPFEGIFLTFSAIMLAFFFLQACAKVKPTHSPAPPVEKKSEVATRAESPVPPTPPEPSPPKTTSGQPPAPPSPKTSSQSLPSSPPASPPQGPRTTKVMWDSVNLREGPGMNYKVTGNVKKGTSLTILEEKGNWLHVRLEDGKEAWVFKPAITEAAVPAPPPSRPNPM